jgi:NAD(P)-dependent dehydrogenase (short-subunit alcohol dehydrogenase family)
MSRRRYEIDGRTVFVTGAARGIGAAVAERLHAAGANVVLVGLEPERLEERAAGLGDRALAVEADVTDADALERAVRSAVERFGAIDVAIANAGIAFVGALATAPVEQVERTLAVDLLGVWRTDRAVLPQVIERKGYLLNVASMAAVTHTPLLGPYSAAKAGVEALSDSLRVELAPTGARVGCAYFGFIDTDLVRAGMAHPAASALQGLVPEAFRRPAPVSAAVDAIEAGIRRGSARVWAPRYVGAALLARGILQPLTERIAMRSGRLAASVQLAEPRAEDGDDQHALLGIAARARAGSGAGEERPRA